MSPSIARAPVIREVKWLALAGERERERGRKRERERGRERKRERDTTSHHQSLLVNFLQECCTLVCVCSCCFYLSLTLA